MYTKHFNAKSVFMGAQSINTMSLFMGKVTEYFNVKPLFMGNVQGMFQRKFIIYGLCGIIIAMSILTEEV